MQEWEEQRELYDDLRSYEPSTRVLFLTPEKVRTYCCGASFPAQQAFMMLTVLWIDAPVRARSVPSGVR